MHIYALSLYVMWNKLAEKNQLKNSVGIDMNKENTGILKTDEQGGSRSLPLLLKTSAKLIKSAEPRLCFQIMVDAIREYGWSQVVLSRKVYRKILLPEDLITAGVTEKEKGLWLNQLSRIDWTKCLGKEDSRFKLGEFYFFPWHDLSVKKKTSDKPLPTKSHSKVADWNPNNYLCTPIKLSSGQIVGSLNLAYPADEKQPTSESLMPIELFVNIATATIEKDLLNQQLLEGEKLFRLMAENAQDVIYRIKLKPKMEVEYVSPSITRISGYSPDDFAADPAFVLKIFHPADAAVFSRILATFEAPKGPLVLRWIRKDGETIWIELTNQFVHDKAGQAVAVEGIARDITERKLIDEKLQYYAERLEEMVDERTQKLKETQVQLLKAERLVAIGNLAAMVGHDLRNPLTSIMACTYYLEKKLGPTANDKIAEMLLLLKKNIAYSNKIITDLLDYSSEIVLEPTERNPRSAVEETLSCIQIPKKITLLNLSESEPKITIDPQKVKRAFTNIITNALDAMPDGGTLRIESKRTSDSVLFAFADTGTGIPRDVMEKLGGPLFTTKAKGMGFGIAICKRIAEAHGGSISIESTVGKGTTVFITLPIEPKNEEGGEDVWINQLESS